MPINADPFQVVRLLTDHSKKLERLESLGTPNSGRMHHTLVVFSGGPVTGGCVGRMRMLCGSGLSYQVVSWAITLDVAGTFIIDILKAGSYPPVNGMSTAFHRPSCVGAKYSTGGVSGWATTTISHGDYLVFNCISAIGIAQAGFSMELAPT